MSYRSLPRLLGSAVIALLAAPGAALLAMTTLGSHGPGLTTVDGVVATGVLLLGAVVLGWYAITAVLACICLGARAAGVAWRSGERAVRAAGAPLLRRVVTASAGAVVAAGMVVAPAAADPAPQPDPGGVAVVAQIPEDETLRADLGWGSSDEARTTGDPTDDATTGDAGPPGPDEPVGPDESDESPEPIEPAEPAEPSQPAESHTSGEPTASAAGDEEPSDEPTEPTEPTEPDEPNDTDEPAEPDEPTEPPEDPTPGSGPSGGSGRSAPVDPAPGSPGHERQGADAPSALHLVTAGESLWSIAAAELGPAATDEQIAERWQQWFQANREVVGADPDLIHPGQQLQAPADTPEEDA